MTNKSYSSFIFVNEADFHRRRRKEILLKYPEVKDLFGHESKTIYISLALVSFQLTLAYWCRATTLFWWLFILYFIGATINHAIFTAIHEITHNLAFKSKKANRYFALLVNLPLGIPAAISFEKYHHLHHRHLGDKKKDGDVPVLVEAKIFNSMTGKLFWLLIQPLTYSLRPIIKWPQKMSSWEISNITLQLLFNVLVTFLFGWKFLGFLILSTLVGMSLHPLATHFIAEHYVAHKQQETYSYYGPLNYLTFNFGHHVEHHDFPGIPWSRTPQLRKIAPEYYNSLYVHSSWLGFMKEFICSKKINLFSRVVRE
ncbi:fatty acid desaturase [Legionella anisa]|uniref:Fatty acid desaturase n=1 Tax=Legionella anisa TaxID=28082 RepID=A0AAX0WXW0_9GAMM|nr:fatty acid desaturase [Legionella anisa]AWN73935.1 fatty acid desaturase [Legionella anisa]KTC67203.1 Fatty acid desaturase [Legionella anisa]MBN5936641.1 fatty acid desaturase [Legionella anisa]MCW8426052.1 fatty acid desaturase [Legionella anisa]MCW8448511.1 fatty acid desaturase [Legionella anisa]